MKASTYEKRIIKNMKSINIYREEFSDTIKALAKIYEKRDKAEEQFEQLGGQFVIKHTNKNGSTNLIKNPLYLAIENMEMRILEYNKELGLTPKGLKQLRKRNFEKENKSSFMEALEKL